MMISTNKPTENGLLPSLSFSPVTAVEKKEEENSYSPSAVRDDSVSISPEASQKVIGQQQPESSNEKRDDSAQHGRDGQPLSDEEKEVVEKLKKRDIEVKIHEQTHMAAGGQYVRGSASYSYQSGPDGGRYAVGGEVNIDTSAVPNDPDATIRKMQSVRAAAMAPADPSGQDRSVAAAASSAMAKAQAEKSKASSAGTGSAGTTQAESIEKNPSENSKQTQRATAIQAYSQSTKINSSQINISG